MSMTYILLGLAIVAVWVPPVRVGGRDLSSWTFAFGAAVAAGLHSGVLSWPALVPLAAMVGLAWLESRWRRHWAGFTWRRGIAGALAGLLALALALHALPGFHNAVLLSAVTLSPGAPPFTQYLNFDKGTAGLFLLLYCSHSAGRADVRRCALSTLAAAALTAVAVVGLALVLGYVRVDPKWPPMGGWRLAANLLFACTAEEALFFSRLDPGAAGLGSAKAAVWRRARRGAFHRFVRAGPRTVRRRAGAAGRAYRARRRQRLRPQPADRAANFGALHGQHRASGVLHLSAAAGVALSDARTCLPTGGLSGKRPVQGAIRAQEGCPGLARQRHACSCRTPYVSIAHDPRGKAIQVLDSLGWQRRTPTPIAQLSPI